MSMSTKIFSGVSRLTTVTHIRVWLRPPFRLPTVGQASACRVILSSHAPQIATPQI